MGYLLHLNVKYSNIFKQIKLIILISSIFIFSFIYYYLSKKHYKIKSTDKMNYMDALYLSIVTQSLLGPGDISPKSDIARLVLMLQVIVTMFVTFIYV